MLLRLIKVQAQDALSPVLSSSSCHRMTIRYFDNLVAAMVGRDFTLSMAFRFAH